MRHTAMVPDPSGGARSPTAPVIAPLAPGPRLSCALLFCSQAIAPSTIMNRRTFLTLAGAVPAMSAAAPARRTEVSIRGEQFFLNGKPTYAGRSYHGLKIEGLLMNVRAAQGIFDDLNPETRGRWAYPDTGKWDPERNTRELVAALPEWRRHGLLAFTINLHGGSPEGYSKSQPWVD